MRAEALVRPAPGRSDPASASVLVIDDEAKIVRALRSLLRDSFTHILSTTSPTEAIGILRRREVAVVICDQMMPGIQGIDLLALIRKRWPRTVTILLTACADVRLVERALNQGLIRYFLTKPWNSDRLLEVAGEAAREYLHEEPGENGPGDVAEGSFETKGIERRAHEAALSLCRAVDSRNAYTRGHSEHVAFYAWTIAQRMGLDEEHCQRVRAGGLLHDLGMIGVPDGILSRSEALGAEDLAILRKHPLIGSSIIAPIGLPDEVRSVIEQHHENFDGSGYPAGLRGDQIALAARIVRVADSYDAMSTDRTYRKALAPRAIVEEFTEHRNSQFDPEVIDALLDALRTGRIEPERGER